MVLGQNRWDPSTLDNEVTRHSSLAERSISTGLGVSSIGVWIA